MCVYISSSFNRQSASVLNAAPLFVPPLLRLVLLLLLVLSFVWHCKAACSWFQHVVDAVLAIQRPGESIDLHMVELMEMQHKTDMDST